MSGADAAKGAACVVLLAAIVAVAHAANPSPVKQICMDAETRERARALMVDGFDQEYRDHVKTIFDVYLRDHADTPDRARNGLNNGANAYARSIAAAKNWNPPECKP